MLYLTGLIFFFLSNHVVSLASNITTILISTLKHTYSTFFYLCRLEFHKADGECMKFVFSQIDRQNPSRQVSLGFKGLSVYFSILLVSCVMWTAALDSSDLIKSYSVISLS